MQTFVIAALLAGGAIFGSIGSPFAPYTGSVSTGVSGGDDMRVLQQRPEERRVEFQTQDARANCGQDIYLAFFQWDQPDQVDAIVGGIANGVIKKAARCGAAIFRVDGHWDTSSDGNTPLEYSRLNAATFRTLLVRKGIEQQRIIVCPKGASRLNVATAPGVREPQNRRVEIFVVYGGEQLRC